MNNPKLHIINGHAYANSIDIARHFGKSHANVLKAIRNRLNDCDSEFSRVNFNATTQRDRFNREQPIYRLTRDGFAFVVMSFTGKQAAKWQIAYINAFNAMESELRRRQIQSKQFDQLQLTFPEIADILENQQASLTVTFALGQITLLGLHIPPLSRDSFIRLIKRGAIQGFKDERGWQVFKDSFESWLELRRRSLVA